MIATIYSIKDELAETFGNLILMNDKVAQRQFNFMAREMEEADAKDRVVYKMGLYDTDTGEIKPLHPQAICNLEQLKEALKNG